MAKKKTVKKVKKIEPTIDKNIDRNAVGSGVGGSIKKATKPVIFNETTMHWLIEENDKLNARIDRIVAAHDKCKSLKGL